MKRIFKFPLFLDDKQVIRLSPGARILHVGEQHGALQMWAMVDDEIEPVDRVIFIRGTGHDAKAVEAMPYIGCVQQMDGSLIWHVFDGGEELAPMKRGRGTGICQ